MLTQPGQEKMASMNLSEQTEQPVVVISRQDTAPAKSGRLTKKHVLIAAVSIVIAGLAVVAVLVGIHLVMQNKLDTLKLSLALKNSGAGDAKQDVSIDNNANVIITHFTTNGNDVTINDDFDKDIQVFKIRSEKTVGCYVTPLNRSNAFDLKSLPTPFGRNVSTDVVNMDANSTGFVAHLSYDVAPTAINDTTFLGKRANALCYNIPIYWLHPTCTGTVLEQGTTADHHIRKKRGISCSCEWKKCYVKVFGIKLFSYVCGFDCKCCLNSVCLTASSSCTACLKINSVYEKCVDVCKLL